METWSDNGAVCPHCGHLNNPNDDSYALYDEGNEEWECGECETSFVVRVHIKYSWICEPKEEG